MRLRARFILSALALALLAACSESAERAPDDVAYDSSADVGLGPDAGEDSGAPDSGAPDSGDSVDDSPLDVMDRPSPVFLPDDYDHGQSHPLIVLLHGFRVSAAIQDVYLGTSKRVSDRDFILTTPSGTLNPENQRFWNAYWCCDFHDQQVDDVGYLTALIEEAKRRFNVDERRVYFIGHSNGGFMSYRMACDVDGIAAIVSIAGSGSEAPEPCEVGAVSVLHVHGTEDATIPYDGVAGQYPGAVEMVQRWASHNRCDPQPEVGEPRDVTTAVAGDETTPQTWSLCDDGASVQLWTIDHGAHIPAFTEGFKDAILDFLLAHTAP